MPAETPVTTPETETVASALLLLHTPVPDPSVNVMVDPTHTLEDPEMLPALGNAFTLIVFVAIAVPHTLVTAYPMVSRPAVTPVITGPVAEAEEFELLHVPPVTLSVKVTEDPVQTPDAPEITPGLGKGFTVMV
jgi:hypothetical protein